MHLPFTSFLRSDAPQHWPLLSRFSIEVGKAFIPRLNPAAQKVRSSSLDISRPAQAENASLRPMQRSEGEAPVGRLHTATHVVANHYRNL
jgi:hypothetical protein